jgi:hypothetical protein
MGSNYRFDGDKQCIKIMTRKFLESGHLEVLEGDRLTYFKEIICEDGRQAKDKD